jgi:hypothetical protein
MKRRPQISAPDNGDICKGNVLLWTRHSSESKIKAIELKDVLEMLVLVAKAMRNSE